MKKLYTLTLLLLGAVTSFAQVVYSENFGTTAPTSSPYPAADAYTGYENGSGSGIIYSGTADARGTLASNGYTGASGGSNIFFSTSSLPRTLIIEGINTSAYATETLQLTFGQQQGSSSETPAANFEVAVSSNGTDWTVLPYTREGSASGWQLITINEGIPSTTNLRIRFTQNSSVQYRVDDVTLSSVAAACTLELGAETTACTESTLNTDDTYTVTLPFTGGNNGTYTVTVAPNMGTVGGDNPSSMAEGNIVVSGITENTNVTITVSATISGEECIVSRDVIGISCEPVNTLPYSESFDYAVDSNLGDSQMWQSVNAGDAAVIVNDNLTYTGVESAGNAVSFSGSGSETYTPFTPTTEGTIFASFLMKVSDMANVTTDGTETVIATLLGDEPSAYNVRLFYKKVGEQYQLGIGALSSSTTTNYTTTSFDVNETVMVILGFNYTNNTLSAWINPTLATLTAGTPATLTETLTELPANGSFDTFNGFLLRQDGAADTPTITVDELRIVTDIEELVLSTPSFDNIAGLQMYPNPLSGNVLNITSDANAAKAVVVYDMLGKEVVNTVTANGTVNVPALNTGIYIVKITEEEKTATRKLVVK